MSRKSQYGHSIGPGGLTSEQWYAQQLAERDAELTRLQSALEAAEGERIAQVAEAVRGYIAASDLAATRADLLRRALEAMDLLYQGGPSVKAIAVATDITAHLDATGAGGEGDGDG